MLSNLVQSPEVQQLLDRASGINEPNGDARLKVVLRDLLEALMIIIQKHDVSEGEFWTAIKFMQDGASELGLLVPGLGLEHFLDLHMDKKDAEAGLTGGTPRTIEGPLYVEGAPLVEGQDVNLCQDANEDAVRLHMSGQVTGPDGEAVEGAILHVWHASSKGFYSHFDPTGAQSAFNNRRRLKLGSDGRYSFHSEMPSGYAVPPGGVTDQLMSALGRHGKRPAHVHFFVEAPGYRTLTTQINFGDDPFAESDFAFGTREGLLPMPTREGDTVHVNFDFRLQRARSQEEQQFSTRARVEAG
jgi:catechol 1,2-dioxygenase